MYWSQKAEILFLKICQKFNSIRNLKSNQNGNKNCPLSPRPPQVLQVVPRQPGRDVGEGDAEVPPPLEDRPAEAHPPEESLAPALLPALAGGVLGVAAVEVHPALWSN